MTADSPVVLLLLAVALLVGALGVLVATGRLRVDTPPGRTQGAAQEPRRTGNEPDHRHH